MNSRAFWIGGSIFALIIILFIPVTQYRVVSYGVDSYVTHTPLFSNHFSSEQFTTNSKTIGIGAILVNLYHAKQLPNVDVKIVNRETKQLLASETILNKDIHDDSFSYIHLSKAISSHTPLEVIFSATGGNIKNPVGLRYGPQKDQLSLALIERVPLWKAIRTIAHNREQDWQYVTAGTLFAFIIAIPALIPIKKSYYWILALAGICVASYVIMLTIIPQFGGSSGGDPYNYLSITQSIEHIQNPFLNSKRLPGYPLLLVPTFASGLFDDQLVMRIVTSTAGILGIILIALIARVLTASWPVALGTAAILAFQKDYIWTAMRPEPYAVYTALLLLALYLFFMSYKKPSLWIQIFFGLTLGYAAMTRQEGFVLAAVFGTLSFFFELFRGRNIRRFISMYIPAFLVVSPFFITNTIVYHNPFYTQYLEGDRLQIVDSFLAFQDAVGSTWGILGSMWKTSWDQLERLSLISLPLVLGILGTWAWYAYMRVATKKSTQNITALVFLGIVLGLVLSSIYAKHELTGLFTPISAGILLASIPIFCIETKWRGIVVITILLSQVGIATWFHPFPKHYEQSYPLIIFMMGTALLSRVPKKGFLAYSALLVTILPFLLIGTMLGQQLNTAIDKQNANTALDSVTYRAARYARTLEQPIGFDQAYLPARLYFDPHAKYFPDEDVPTPQMEQDWLQDNPIKTLVVSNGNNVFKKPQPNWTVIKTFKAAGNDEKIFESIVYSVH